MYINRKKKVENDRCEKKIIKVSFKDPKPTGWDIC